MPINLVCSATKSSMEVAMATAAGQLKAAGQLAAVQQIWKAAGQLAAVQQIWKIWKKQAVSLRASLRVHRFKQRLEPNYRARHCVGSKHQYIQHEHTR